MRFPQPRNIAYTLLVFAAIVGGWMYSRATAEELWGYRPLLLYLLLFGGYFLFRYVPNKKSPKPGYLLPVYAGALLGLGFAGDFGIFPALFVGFVPMFILFRKLQERNAGYAEAFRLGFTAFLLFNILTTYWVTNTGFGPGLFAMLANSVLMSLPWLAFYWTGRKSPKVAFLAFGACWIAFEHLHYNWGLNWPWLTLGNGMASWPALIQWYEVTGVLGGSAWILGCNYLAFKALSAPAAEPQKLPSPGKLLSFLALVLLPISGSLVRYYTYVAPEDKTITVAAIQPNFEPHFEKFAAGGEPAVIDTFVRLSKDALAAGPLDYIVYPETSFSNFEEDRPLLNGPMRILQSELGNGSLGHLVTGYSGYHAFQAGEPLSPAARTLDRGNGTLFRYEHLNAALQLDLDTKEVQHYRKGVFVPGAESFPFRKVLFFMEPLVASLGGSVAGLGTQETRTPFSSPKAKIAPVICYESVFGEYFTDYIREGAQAVFVMTNDGWWDNTAGHKQHLYYSSLRAIETRRAVVRSANVGACAFIDQRGQIISTTQYNEAGFLRGEMQLNDAITPYVRYGDIVSRIALLLAGMVLLSNLARSLRRN
ncbi:apolipoprotein N-acyltransferase [Neolewinella aurantiaca]|uniref:Apolipoprotein N-acyltransferase n=1 Tax=Neolewinella aurantiaca TaxID=2602767 RepID=A0A5C7FE80_9BACT|nr:apolipoprotein N-acyltransferase [Neolewinella aurantiaca]TXF89027.1 apolipoprotein N-acyltransferase [Neolewinella aurantiaca]